MACAFRSYFEFDNGEKWDAASIESHVQTVMGDDDVTYFKLNPYSKSLCEVVGMDNDVVTVSGGRKACFAKSTSYLQIVDIRNRAVWPQSASAGMAATLFGNSSPAVKKGVRVPRCQKQSERDARHVVQIEIPPFDDNPPLITTTIKAVAKRDSVWRPLTTEVVSHVVGFIRHGGVSEREQVHRKTRRVDPSAPVDGDDDANDIE